jgi:excinuclease ABC subunit B
VRQVVRPTGLIDPEPEVRPALHQVDDLMAESKRRIAIGERVLVTVLTKRMAEDLTDYLADHGIKVRYLHSDIDTVERMEIKEGFLRSERSLIQTIGRAARNLNGKAILYADRMTGSMERAIAVTLERRRIQTEYNLLHGITPRSVRKSITDVMELGGSSDAAGSRGKTGSTRTDKGRTDKRGSTLTGAELQEQIRKLEDKMLAHARNLEFEEAAIARDELARLNQALLII